MIYQIEKDGARAAGKRAAAGNVGLPFACGQRGERKRDLRTVPRMGRQTGSTNEESLKRVGWDRGWGTRASEQTASGRAAWRQLDEMGQAANDR